MMQINHSYTLDVDFGDGKSKTLKVSVKNLLSTVEVLTTNGVVKIVIKKDTPPAQMVTGTTTTWNNLT